MRRCESTMEKQARKTKDDASPNSEGNAEKHGKNGIFCEGYHPD
jgi:hypothetical protein